MYYPLMRLSPERDKGDCGSKDASIEETELIGNSCISLTSVNVPSKETERTKRTVAQAAAKYRQFLAGAVLLESVNPFRYGNNSFRNDELSSQRQLQVTSEQFPRSFQRKDNALRKQCSMKSFYVPLYAS
jgi:hypothetical protein